MSTEATDPTAGMSESEAAEWYQTHRDEVESWDWGPAVPLEPVPREQARAVMSVRFSTEELAAVAAAAERHDMKVGSYIRQAALLVAQSELLPNAPPAAELLRMVTELQKNVTQQMRSMQTQIMEQMGLLEGEGPPVFLQASGLLGLSEGVPQQSSEETSPRHARQ